MLRYPGNNNLRKQLPPLGNKGKNIETSRQDPVKPKLRPLGRGVAGLVLVLLGSEEGP